MNIPVGGDLPADTGGDAANGPLLNVDHLSVNLKVGTGRVTVVDDVGFTVRRRETLAIVGESGSGKSLTARAVVGLLPRDIVDSVTGSILFKGKDLTQYTQRELSKTVRGSTIGIVFQDPMTSLNPVVSVGDQVAEPLRRHLGMSRSSARRRAAELLAEVRIPDADSRIDDLPYQFSGGMRQRVLIAAAMSCQPELLIADEPTTALDATVQMEILELLSLLQRDHQMGMIFISHDLHLVSRIADEVLVMYAGEVVERSRTRELFLSPAHPYTVGLLSSIPSVERDHKKVRLNRLKTISGRPPSPLDYTVGCRFYDRCDNSQKNSSCQSSRPSLSEVSTGHWVRCLYPSLEYEVEQAVEILR